MKKLRRLAGEAIEQYRMIRPGDRILIGLSGGKDSFVLAEVLYALQKAAPVEFELVTATFDPGFTPIAAERIRAYAEKRGWEHHAAGMDVAALIREKDRNDHPCVLCSRMRRGHLYRLCRELHCNRLALGHHADDAAVSFLMSLFRGQGLRTMGPNVPGDGEAVRVIRPLTLAPESLIAACAESLALPEDGKCPYHAGLDENGDRASFRELLRQVEKRIPDFRTSMLHSMGKIEEEHLLDLRFLQDRQISRPPTGKKSF